MKKLVLLRHGESVWNKENRFTNVAFDGGSVSTSCVYDSASKRNHFLGCWASTQATGGRGIVIDSTDVVGFRWTDGEIVGIAQHGVQVSAAGDFHIIGGRICNWGTRYSRVARVLPLGERITSMPAGHR